MSRRVALLVGSPRKASTSEALGSYLLERLQAHGWEATTLHLYPALRRDARWQAVMQEVGQADLTVLASPLYVDALPAAVVEGLERLAHSGPAPKRLVALINSGFPEAHQNEVALAICRQFARETGSAWLGGLALGGGMAIDGKPLKRLGGMTRNVRKALNLAATTLAALQPIPPKAVALMAKPLIPTWSYVLLGSWGWWRQARRYGTQRRLKNRPYEAEEP